MYFLRLFLCVNKTLIFERTKFLPLNMMEKRVKGYYDNAEKQLVAVDCIIFGFDDQKLKLLLFKRKVQPFQGQWSLIGSFVKDQEDVKNAAKRVLEESTGLINIFLEELQCYGSANRDPGARVISIAHYALVRLQDHENSLVDTYHAKWFDVNAIPALILDHNDMVNDALDKLRRKARSQPIGFELLPKKFTLPQLKVLYDEIHQKDLDRRNFRKRILAMNILKKLEEKDKTTSKKGAYLYQFDKEQYERLKAEGFNFEL